MREFAAVPAGRADRRPDRRQRRGAPRQTRVRGRSRGGSRGRRRRPAAPPTPRGRARRRGRLARRAGAARPDPRRGGGQRRGRGAPRGQRRRGQVARRGRAAAEPERAAAERAPARRPRRARPRQFTPPEPAKPIHGIRLFFSVLWERILRLFGRRPQVAPCRPETRLKRRASQAVARRADPPPGGQFPREARCAPRPAGDSRGRHDGARARLGGRELDRTARARPCSAGSPACWRSVWPWPRFTAPPPRPGCHAPGAGSGTSSSSARGSSCSRARSRRRGRSAIRAARHAHAARRAADRRLRGDRDAVGADPPAGRPPHAGRVGAPGARRRGGRRSARPCSSGTSRRRRSAEGPAAWGDLALAALTLAAVLALAKVVLTGAGPRRPPRAAHSSPACCSPAASSAR